MQTQPAIERRQQRSSDPIMALHHQLSAVRSSAKLDALVLVDDLGCLVAGSGAWPVCEELAAYAPLLANDSLARFPEVDEQTQALADHVVVRTVEIDGVEAVLCAKGSAEQDILHDMERAATGCKRILITASHGRLC